MDLGVLFFLTSGLLLGWSLGANDAANVFGTAVGTRMVSFTTAAIVCSVFIILGAVISGSGAAHTLGKLGSINALAGSFMAALSAAVTVYAMTKWGLPVSTSQAIVGAIIGWNFFSESITDVSALLKIVTTWVVCPLLAGLIAVPIFKLVEVGLRTLKLHLLRLDAYTRFALILAGAFGSYSLGANNIANVMGVFVPASPFTDFDVGTLFTLTSMQQLFLLGAIAIGVGVFTYSKRVMLTVGQDLLPLSPVSAWVVVVAHSIVLFLFASEGLEFLLASNGLPTIPLVPVSSSQAVVGAVIGLGLMRGGRNIRWRVLGSISIGWITTPLIAAVLCFVALFFLQNVFNQQVYREVSYFVDQPVEKKLAEEGIAPGRIAGLKAQRFLSGVQFVDAMEGLGSFTDAEIRTALKYAEWARFRVDQPGIDMLDERWLTPAQTAVFVNLEGKTFRHKWRLADALAAHDTVWQKREDTVANKAHNKLIDRKLDHVYRTFEIAP